MSARVLFKVGGSLLDWPGFPQRLQALIDQHSGEGLVLIVGGGRAADIVRDFDTVHHIGESRSHGLALHALDFTSRLLATLIPRSQVVESLVEIPNVLSADQIPIFAPRRFLELDDQSSNPLPHTWAVTTDSIAARVAHRLRIDRLMLIKSVSAAMGMTRIDAARQGIVDPYFPVASRSVRNVTVRNLRDPEATDRELL